MRLPLDHGKRRARARRVRDATMNHQSFGVAKSTASAKARKIMDALDITVLDPRWCLPSLLADNPRVWFIQVDGLIVDARYESREIQEEAFRLGLIPYVP